jgi:hypothetical protein
MPVQESSSLSVVKNSKDSRSRIPHARLSTARYSRTHVTCPLEATRETWRGAVTVSVRLPALKEDIRRGGGKDQRNKQPAIFPAHQCNQSFRFRGTRRCIFD